jgi:hypothetical protein
LGLLSLVLPEKKLLLMATAPEFAVSMATAPAFADGGGGSIAGTMATAPTASAFAGIPGTTATAPAFADGGGGSIVGTMASASITSIFAGIAGTLLVIAMLLLPPDVSGGSGADCFVGGGESSCWNEKLKMERPKAFRKSTEQRNS